MNSPRMAFKAVLWKEFRENFKWAVLGLLLVSAGMAHSLLQFVNYVAYGNQNWSLNEPNLFQTSAYLTPLVGFSIGLAQVVLENRGDKWGFLTHRPMRRSTLFWGKSVAGILLYLGAVVVPLSCALIWIAAPGHLPMPFDARMVLPFVADVLCGLVYFFAGLLTGMRDARWYGSRVMGIGAGLVCSIALFGVPEFWQAAAGCTLGTLITGAAAWGAFVEGGHFESQARITRFATGISIGAGLLVSGMVLYGVSASFVPIFVTHSATSRYTVTGDGTVVKTLRRSGSIVEVQDLEGRPMERYKDRASRGSELTRGVVASQMISLWSPQPWNGNYRSTNEYFRVFVSSDALSNGATFSWYYMPRLGRIAAYENRSAKLVGWMGPGGFTPGADMPEDRFRFPSEGYSVSRPRLFAFADAVYRLDLNHRHIEKVFTADSGETIFGASDSNSAGTDDSDSRPNARFVVVSTSKRVVVQSLGGVIELMAPRSPDGNEYESVAVYRALRSPDPQTLVWYSRRWENPSVVTRFGSSNSSIASVTLPSVFRSETLTWGFVMIRSIMDNIAFRLVKSPQSIWNNSAIELTPYQLLVSWMIPIFQGVLFASLAFARGRRYAFPRGRLGFWTAMGLAFGPLGFALMMSLLEWPAFEKCPGCGRSRLVTHDNCEHCRNPFTRPHVDGTEVFEPVTSN